MAINTSVTLLSESLNILVNSDKYEFSDLQSITIPTKPGLYAIYDSSGEHLLYIGESRSLRRRLLSDHLKGDKIGSSFRRNISQWLDVSEEVEISDYISHNCQFQFFQCDLKEAKRLEHFAIAVLEPILNK